MSASLRIFAAILLAACWLGRPSGTRAAITGHWDFDIATNRLAATIGLPLEYFDGPGAPTETKTKFGPTTSFMLPGIGGKVAQVMAFPQMTETMGYKMFHGVPANGGGTLANQWTVIMDVLFPTSSSGKWRALIQTDEANPANDDAEFYLNLSNGLGINSSYQGNVPANTWVRLAIAVDMSAPANQIVKYINGVKVGVQNPNGLDGRFALTPGAADFALLFTDGYGSGGGGPYTQPGYVNSIQIHDQQLSGPYIAALGGPSAAGIPTSVQPIPYLNSSSPTPGEVSAPPVNAFTATIVNGVSKVVTNSIQLDLNGNTVTPAITAANGLTTVTFSAPGLLPSGSTNDFTLRYRDDASPAHLLTNDIPFVVAAYVDLELPAPIVFENFDLAAEQSLPAGWTQTNYTDTSSSDATVDFGNLDSAAFETWAVVNVARFDNSFVTYTDPTATTLDYQRVLSVNPSNVVNGEFVAHLATGRFAFGDSGYRNGASQVMYLFSPDFNLTGQTNVHLSFHSLWEQNQDSIAAVEYSVDHGQTWLPIVYLLETGNVITDGAGHVDALTTFTNTYTGDRAVAVYTDPADGQDKGGYYGAFIGVASNLWSTLGPFISPRVDDDPVGSKRVEYFRLPQADNQASVRFRFAHAGSDSWYFGIDDLGLYSIITTVESPTLTTSVANNQLTISWPVGVTGFTLEQSDRLTSPAWTAVNGVVNNSVTVPISVGNKFYRARQ